MNTGVMRAKATQRSVRPGIIMGEAFLTDGEGNYLGEYATLADAKRSARQRTDAYHNGYGATVLVWHLEACEGYYAWSCERFRYGHGATSAVVGPTQLQRFVK